LLEKSKYRLDSKRHSTNARLFEEVKDIERALWRGFRVVESNLSIFPDFENRGVYLYILSAPLGPSIGLRSSLHSTVQGKIGSWYGYGQRVIINC
jgi:hypothetical protein